MKLLMPMVTARAALQVIATAVFVLVPAELAWARDVRMYQQMQFFAVVFIALFIRALHRGRSRDIVGSADVDCARAIRIAADVALALEPRDQPAQVAQVDRELTCDIRRRKSVAVGQFIEDSSFGQRELGAEQPRVEQTQLSCVEAIETSNDVYGFAAGTRLRQSGVSVHEVIVQ